MGKNPFNLPPMSEELLLSQTRKLVEGRLALAGVSFRDCYLDVRGLITEVISKRFPWLPLPEEIPEEMIVRKWDRFMSKTEVNHHLLICVVLDQLADGAGKILTPQELRELVNQPPELEQIPQECRPFFQAAMLLAPILLRDESRFFPDETVGIFLAGLGNAQTLFGYVDAGKPEGTVPRILDRADQCHVMLDDAIGGCEAAVAWGLTHELIRNPEREEENYLRFSKMLQEELALYDLNLTWLANIIFQRQERFVVGLSIAESLHAILEHPMRKDDKVARWVTDLTVARLYDRGKLPELESILQSYPLHAMGVSNHNSALYGGIALTVPGLQFMDGDLFAPILEKKGVSMYRKETLVAILSELIGDGSGLVASRFESR